MVSSFQYGATISSASTGIWYGKEPGVDRCGDVFKHANAAGFRAHGGVLAIMGDDPVQFVNAGAPERAGDGCGDDADLESGDVARDYLDFGLFRVCAVAIFRLLGWFQGGRADGGDLWLGRGGHQRGRTSSSRPIS